jgi:hypothetical protein
MIDVKIDKKTIKITVIGRGAVSIHGHLLSKDDFAILSSAASEIGNRPK